MALLKIQVPRGLRGNRSLEAFFYSRFANLRRVSLSRFTHIDILAHVLNTNSHNAKNYLIFSKSVHGFEHQGTIFIHPDGVVRRIKFHAKRQIRKLLIATPKVLSEPGLL